MYFQLILPEIRGGIISASMIIDKIRDLSEFEALYRKRPMRTDIYPLELIINNPHLYCFYKEEDGKLSGFIFLTENDEKLFLSGVAEPKILPEIVNAIIAVCRAYECDIYADTDLKHAQFALRRAGFEKTGKNLLIRRNEWENRKARGNTRQQH